MKPNFEKNNITVIFSADNNYVKNLIVTIKSLICNSSKKFNYDIYVLNEDINADSQKLTKSLEEPNVKINFVDTKSLYDNIDKSIFYLHSYLTISTYNRFFIPRLFKNFERVVYLDCDTIILDDVAKLYNKNLNGNAIGATIDLGVKYPICAEDIRHINYFDNQLKLIDKDKYFQAGVMVFDIKKLLELDFENKCIEKLKEIKTPMYPDQCIMNKVLENNVEIIDLKWDILWHLPIEYKNYKKILPNKLVDEYEKGFKNPQIIHFAGKTKPWKNPYPKNANIFWKYAIRTPVFGELVKNLINDFIFKSTQKIRLLKILYLG